MGKIKKQIKSEIKHLPFTLSKLIGGAMAVIGFPGVIIIITRKSNPSYLDIMPYFILGIIGVSVFLLSSRLFEKRMNENTDFVPTTKETYQHNFLDDIFNLYSNLYINYIYYDHITRQSSGRGKLRR